MSARHNASNSTQSPKQLGKKLGSHAEDFGLDPANPAHRQWMQKRIEGIVRHYDELRQGPWRGGASDYLFYREGADVVVTTPNSDFVTLLSEGATNNKFYQGARPIFP